MRIQRDARKHDTLRAQAGVNSEDYADFKVRQRVHTVDGYPGRIVAVHDGPYPGTETYEVELDGGMGGGQYLASQLSAAADGEYTASRDYPELAEILVERPDPGKQVVLARKTATTLPDDHPNKVWLRFGDWPDDERSVNNVMGWKEEGVSAYDLDHHGDPVDPDAEMSRWHDHDEHCGPDCDLDQWNEDYTNDTGEEMRDRVHRAEKNRYRGNDFPGETGHLVKGTFAGVGHDGEPLLHNVRRVGDWIDHRHLFIPTAEPHRLARHPADDDYEEPEETPPGGHQQRLYSRQATTINGTEVDDHGEAPHRLRATDPNSYDKESTEGDPGSIMYAPLSERDKKGAEGGELMKYPEGVSVASLIVPAAWHDPEQGLDHWREWDNGGHEDHSTGWMDPERGNDYEHEGEAPEDDAPFCGIMHTGPCPTFPSPHREASLHEAMPSKYHSNPEGFTHEVHENNGSDSWWIPAKHLGTHVLHGYINGQHVGTIHYSPSDDGNALKVEMLHATDRGRGAASAMMDALYTEHPKAWINHGWRTDNGLRWWNAYEDPDPSRNVHKAHPEAGWSNYFNPHKVASDMWRNYSNDEDDEHQPPHFDPSDYDEHDGEPERVGPYWENARDHYHRGTTNNLDAWGEYPDPERADSYGEHEEEPEEMHHPDPREEQLHHGTSVYLHPTDHAIVHNPNLPTEVRANHLMHAIGHGRLPRENWMREQVHGFANAYSHAMGATPNSGGTHPRTEVTFHLNPLDRDEVTDSDGDVHFTTNEDTNRERTPAAHFHSPYGYSSPIQGHLNGVTWREHGAPHRTSHSFQHENNGMGRAVALEPDIEHFRRQRTGEPLINSRSYSEYGEAGAGGDREHPDWYQELKENEKRSRPNEPVAPGFGEQKKLFSSKQGANCYYQHEGPCPTLGDKTASRHTAMPSRKYPEPENFNYRVERLNDRYPGASTHALYGFVGPRHVGTIHFTKSDDGGAVKVDMLHSHDKIPGVKGVASAMMDRLYQENAGAWINHGTRTPQGARWWEQYKDPAPERNIHNHAPDAGWDQYFHPMKVALDAADNYIGDSSNNSMRSYHLEKYPEPEREDNGTPIDVWGPHWQRHHWAQGRGGERYFGDDGPQISHVYAAREDDDDLNDTLFPGGDATDRWYEPAHLLPPHTDTGGRAKDDPEWALTHAEPFDESNHKWQKDLVSMNSKTAKTFWDDRLPEIRKEHAETNEPQRIIRRMRRVGHPDKEGYAYLGDGGAWCPECKKGRERLGEDTSDMWPISWGDLSRSADPSHGERCSDCDDELIPPRPHPPCGDSDCPSSLADVLHGTSDERSPMDEHVLDNWRGRESEYDENTPTHLEEYGQNWHGEDHFNSTLAEKHEQAREIKQHEQASQSAEHQINQLFSGPEFEQHRKFLEDNGKGPTHYSKRLRDPYALVSLAATDPELRFHFTASWADVRAKAKRIRSQGKVRITLATTGMVIGEVQGDHHTYETGIQRMPDRKLAVAGWSCGCKWAAYHWGAADDFSRFAGRMCSHALALQFEAQSRGMFGNVVEIDKSKPDWVPPRVVVKYNPDTGANSFVRSSAKQAQTLETPLETFRAWAFLQGESQGSVDLLLRTAGLIEAAVNSPFGEPEADVAPKPYGATSPPNPFESPASAGFLSTPDPKEWDALDPTGMMAMSTLHPEPEPALPFTDGEREDLIGEGDELSPEDPSIQTIGNQMGGNDAILDEALHDNDEDQDGSDLGSIVAAFQASPAAQAMMSGGKDDKSDADIAKAAKLALKQFTDAEQRELINEGLDVRASNLDRLDIAGTHYADLEEDDPGWML